MSQVRDLMVTEVVTIEPSATVVDAAKTMIEREKGPLPVLDQQRPVGMITDRDLVARVVMEGRDPNSVKVSDIATTEVVSITPDRDIDDARQMMSEHQLDRLMVVEDDHLVGIISEADVRRDEGPLA